MKNKNKILLTISLAFFLICLSGVSAAIWYCGDGICDTGILENDPRSINFCPIDCSFTVNETWCDTTYPRDCPTCGNCICDVSRISNSDLNNWCSANSNSCGSDCPFPFAKHFAIISITGNSCKDGIIIIGMLLVTAGLIGGYGYKKKHK